MWFSIYRVFKFHCEKKGDIRQWKKRRFSVYRVSDKKGDFWFIVFLISLQERGWHLLYLSEIKKAIFTNFACEKEGDILGNITL